MAVMSRASNRMISSTPTPASGNVVERVSSILGYDIAETQIVQSDTDLYQRVRSRLAHPSGAVPAEDVFGDSKG